MDSKLFKFIDADLYPAVFTTEALLAQDELPFTRRRYRKGEVIFRAEECHPYTYHVASGLVRLFLSSPEGAVKTLFCHAAGTQFAFQGFKRDRTTKSTAQAVTDCELLAIDYGDLIAFCDAHTEYYMAYIEYLFSITSSQTEEIASLSFQTGLQRVAQLLVVLTGDEDLVVPYSIEELAEMVGAHRNTVSNALSRLRKAGLLEPSTRPIVVADLESLRVVAESGASS